MIRSLKRIILSLVIPIGLLGLLSWTRLSRSEHHEPPLPIPRSRSRRPFPNVAILAEPPPAKTNPDPSPSTFLPLDTHSPKAHFIDSELKNELGGPLDHSALRDVCARRSWNDKLLFECDYVSGGVGNARNHLLSCVRFAIEAGASLVVPGLTGMRSKVDVTVFEEGKTGELKMDLGYLFDKRWFVESLQIGCPGMRLFERVEDFPDYSGDGKTKLAQKVTLIPASLDNWVPKWGLAHPETWRTWFDNWLDGQRDKGEKMADTEEEKLMHVGLGRTYLEYPVYHDSKQFAHNFGKIIRFREDARTLAATVLWELSERFFNGTIDPQDEVIKQKFFGVHLRTETDAVKAWPEKDWYYQSYEVQAELLLEEIRKAALDVVYVASGDLNEVQRFTRDIQRAYIANGTHPPTVVTKSSLLAGTPDLQTLENLTFDQGALIDFLVLLKASQFAGVSHSSFAWNIALKRHLLVPDPKNKHLEGPQMLSDSLSQIFGQPRKWPEYAYCMWP